MRITAPGRLAYLAFNIAVVAFLLTPLLVVGVYSINPTRYLAFPPSGFTLDWYAKFFASSTFMNALGLSLGVASIVVVLATVLGTLAALALTRGRLPGARTLTAFFLAPLMLPALITGFAMFQSLIALGLGRPLWGLVIGHTIIATPYVIRTTLAVLADFDRRIEEAAAVFGATPAQVFFEVTLPLIRPGVIAGAMFAFISSFDQFPVSLFLVNPGSETLPITLFNYIKFDLDGTLAAASMVSIVLALLVVVVTDRLVGLRATMSI